MMDAAGNAKSGPYQPPAHAHIDAWTTRSQLNDQLANRTERSWGTPRQLAWHQHDALDWAMPHAGGRPVPVLYFAAAPRKREELPRIANTPGFCSSPLVLQANQKGTQKRHSA